MNAPSLELLLLQERETEVFCTLLNSEGYECGGDGVLQILPSGDEVRCRTHISKGPQYEN